jgi:hypothetical protein
MNIIMIVNTSLVNVLVSIIAAAAGVSKVKVKNNLASNMFIQTMSNLLLKKNYHRQDGSSFYC